MGKKADLGKRAMSAACALALAAGLVPAPAFGAVQAASVGDAAGGAPAAKAAAIDALDEGAYADDSIIVVYREEAHETKAAERGMTALSVEPGGVGDASAEVLSASAGADAGASVVVEVPDGKTVGQAVVAAESDPDVLYAQPNFHYYLLDEPNADNVPAKTIDAVAAAAMSYAPADSSESYELPDDPYVSIKENDTADYPSKPNQWWIHSVGAPAAWQQVHGDDNPVTVAVLDTGIDFTHEDLKENILADYAYDSYRETKLTESIDDDEMQHGCHVAGIIAATANNGRGIAGASYNAKVLPIRVFHQADMHSGGKATCSDEDLIRAYDYLMSDEDGNGKTVAEETNTRVVNMSLGGYIKDEADYYGGDPMDYYDYAFEDKIHEAQEEANILTVAAAGNGDSSGYGRTDASYPSDYDDVMGVMALKTDTARTRWSDYNDHKDISAPGNNIFSTYWSATEGSAFNGTKYAFESGTSMATPLVCGCAALLWAYDPNLSVADVKEALYETATDYGDPYGHGRVNIGAAVASLGTASVKGEANTMVRTATQQMTASEIADATSVHKWSWSVSDADGNATSAARIDAAGKLTACEAGRVVVTATAKDNAAITGRRNVQITEIQIADGITAAANPAENTIAVRWAEPGAATSYRIERATNAAGDTTAAGEFSKIDEVAAADITSGGSVTYLDRTAEVGELYWYRVMPVGTLASADGKTTTSVEGIASTSKRAFFTDKAVLKANILEAEDVLAETVTSVDGAGVKETVLWTTTAVRKPLKTALNSAYSAYMNGTMLQATVDARTEALSGALATFKAARQPGKVALLANTLSASAVAAVQSVTYNTAGTFAASKVVKVAKAQGAVTYALAPGTNKNITVNAKSGALSVKKGLACGTYPVKVNVTAAGNDSYKEATKQVSFNVKVGKANPMTAKAKAVSMAAGKSVAAGKAFTVSKAQGKVTYKKASGNAKITVASNGQVAVKAGLKKGSYTIKVNVTAAGNKTYLAATKQLSVKVTVR